MTPTLRIECGDCLEVMKTLLADSMDAIVTDPPYGLGFMGKEWDHGVPGVEFWTAALRVAKPGAHLLAFGGTRTFHRLACAIEDAGWEIRDTVMWVYGSGFPKSLDVSKAIDKAAGAERKREKCGGLGSMHSFADDAWTQEHQGQRISDKAITDAAKQWSGWGTALKPAWEPIIVARKPPIGTVAQNVLQYGTGAMNIDACRVPVDAVADASQLRTMNRGMRVEDTSGQVWGLSKNGGDTPDVVSPNGRWPANLIHDGSDEVLACFPDEAGAAAPVHTRNGDKFRTAYGKFAGNVDEAGSTFHAGSGSAARFFYTAKASRADRCSYNTHPTVKPIALMSYLCRLVCPPGGTVLDPFAGSGTTGRAALQEGFNSILIDLDLANCALMRDRTNVTPGLPL